MQKKTTMSKNKSIREEQYNQKNILTKRAEIGITVLPLVIMIISRILKISCNLNAMQAIMLLCFACIAGLALFWSYKGKMNSEKALLLIIAIGIVLRIGYMDYTNWTERYHDVGNTDGNGHGGYIINNILKMNLPETNENQFYHPPLYHILSAIVIKIVAVLKNSQDYADLLNYAEAVSCMAMCASLLIVQRIMDEVKISRRYQIVGMVGTACYPNLIFMGGRVNNDALVTMFMLLSVYFAIRWYYNERLKDIVGIALSIGLGMMTKISCGTVAVLIGPIMLYKVYIGIKNKKAISVIRQLIIFAIICFPLALWYPVRNYVLFNQGLNYVTIPGIPRTDIIHSFASRLLAVPIFQLFKQPYLSINNDYNVFLIMIRTSLFGEWSFNVSKIISISLICSTLIFMGISMVGMVYVVYKSKGKFEDTALFVLWLVLMVSFYLFNISMPYLCTANARYIPVAAIIRMVYASKFCMLINKNGRYFVNIIEGLTILNGVLVMMLYTTF